MCSLLRLICGGRSSLKGSSGSFVAVAALAAEALSVEADKGSMANSLRRFSISEAVASVHSNTVLVPWSTTRRRPPIVRKAASGGIATQDQGPQQVAACGIEPPHLTIRTGSGQQAPVGREGAAGDPMIVLQLEETPVVRKGSVMLKLDLS